LESWSERALHPLDLDQELLLLILVIKVKGRLKIKPSKFLPKTVASRAAWLSRKAPAPTQKWARGFAGGAPASSALDAAADSPLSFLAKLGPASQGDLHAPGDRFPGRSVILGMIGAVIRPESSPDNPA
jgi:hypothetical protein